MVEGGWTTARDHPVPLVRRPEEAAEFYVSVFPNSRIVGISRYGKSGPGRAGSVMTVGFHLDGPECTALNGGPAHDGCGEAIACRWPKDRYGPRWEIVPTELPSPLSDPGPAGANRAMQAMLGTTKLDIAARAAADGAAAPTG